MKKSVTENERPRPSTDVRDLMLLDTYHIIKRYLEDGTSTNRSNLWLQSQKIRSHVLVKADLTIEKKKSDPITTSFPMDDK